MAQHLVDIHALDLSRDVMEEEEIRALIPHAHEFRMIDGICHLDLEEGVVVGYKDWDENAWWGRGHIPGRPILPGVLMVEGGAQVSSILLKKMLGWGVDRFIGLGGLDNVRFRGIVTPPARIYLVSRAGTRSTRMARTPAQCFHEGKLIMEMELLGVLI